MGSRWLLRGSKFYLVDVFGNVIIRVPLYFFKKNNVGRNRKHRFVSEVELVFYCYSMENYGIDLKLNTYIYIYIVLAFSKRGIIYEIF